MRKVFAIIGALVLTTALYGCGNNSSTDERRGAGGDETTVATLQKIGTVAGTGLQKLAVDQSSNTLVVAGNDNNSPLTGTVVRFTNMTTMADGWPRTLTATMNSTTSQKIVRIKTNGTRTATMHVESPDGIVVVETFHNSGAPANLPFVVSELNQNPVVGDIEFDGDILYVSSTGGTAGNSIYKGDVVAGGAITELSQNNVRPEHIAIRDGYLFAAGDNGVACYLKNFSSSSPVWFKSWSAGTNPAIHDAFASDTLFYVAGSTNGHMMITAYSFSNGAISWSKEYPDIITGPDVKVRLGMNASNELVFTLDGKLGKLNRLNGSIISTAPIAVPDSDFELNGNTAVFLSGSDILSLDTDHI